MLFENEVVAQTTVFDRPTQRSIKSGGPEQTSALQMTMRNARKNKTRRGNNEEYLHLRLYFYYTLI